MGVLNKIQKDEEFYQLEKLLFPLQCYLEYIGHGKGRERKDKQCGTSSYVKTSTESMYRFSDVLGLIRLICARVITSMANR